MPEKNESSHEKKKLARIRLPRNLLGEVKAVANHMDITQHDLAHFILNEWMSEHWEGRVTPYEEKEKLIQFVRGDES